MRRILALPGIVVASLVLAACAPGSLDADPPAASGAPEPSASASPSASPEPTPEAQRFDGVDLAAALVPLTFEPADPESWGAWTTTVRDRLLPDVDARAFASVASCASAVDALVALEPGEVVQAGYPYEGTLVTSILVARLETADAAIAFVAAADAAAAACEDAEGVAVEAGGAMALRGPFAPSAVIDDAGYGFVAVGNEGSHHYYGRVVAAHHELVLLATSDMMSDGWDERVVADIRFEIDALEAALS